MSHQFRIFIIFLIISMIFIIIGFLPYNVEDFIYRHSKNILFPVIKYFSNELSRILILLFIILSVFDFKYLNNSLISFNDSATAYIFILTTIMTYSIDISFMEFNFKDFKYSSKSYLGIKEIPFLCKPYFYTHKLIRNKLFYLLLIFFTIYPCIGLNKYLIKFKFPFYLFSAMWQISSLYIIFILVSLIISDFSIVKHEREIINDPFALRDKIENYVIFILKKYLSHDYIIQRVHFNFMHYLLNLYNKCDENSKIRLINISKNIFFGKITQFWIKKRWAYPSIVKLTEKYMRFIFKMKNEISASDLVSFTKDYINLLGCFYDKGYTKDVVSKFSNFSNTNGIKYYVIPESIYNKFLYDSKDGSQSILEDISNIVLKSDLVSYIITRNSSHNDGSLYSFKYLSHGYKNIDKEFIQYNLRLIILCRIQHTDEIGKDNMKFIKFNINNIQHIAPTFFRCLVIRLIKSGRLSKYLIKGSYTRDYLIHKYSN